MDINEDRNKEDLFSQEEPGGGLLAFPEQLNTAPEEIKELYIKWLQMENEKRAGKNRYYTFVNQVTKEVEEVDLHAFQGIAVKMAKNRNISREDLTVLLELCAGVELMKQQKGRLKNRWMGWVRKKYGDNIFDWRRADVLDLFARFHTQTEIRETIIGWGYKVSIIDVQKFFLKHKDLIEKKRHDFIMTSKDYYLATDAGRMETLSMLHFRFVNLFNAEYSKPNPSRDVLGALSREIRGVIEQARKEIKGDEVKLTIDGKIDINASLQAANTMHEISKKMPINMIPVYLVAAKMGINPDHIMVSLVNSLYKDFNGYQKLHNDGSPPSTMDIIRNYDWNEIAAYHANKPNVAPESLTVYEEVPFVEQAKIKTKREKLQQLLNEGLKEVEEGGS